MAAWENYEEEIHQYLEGKMKPEEEVLFMQKLSSNEELRKQYEEELLVRVLFNHEDDQKEEDFSLLQPAGEPAGIIRTGKQKENKATSVLTFKKYAIAAAVLLLVAGGITWIIIYENKAIHIPATAVKTGVPTNQNDSLIHKAEVAANSIVTINKDSLYATLYTPYAVSENDPAELANVYKNLKKGNLINVISTQENDIQLMGADDRNEVIKQYLHLYKGIAYSNQNKTANALSEWNEVIKTADKTEPQFYDAQWYSALAWLKRREINKVKNLATDITNSNSPYKNKAAVLLQDVSGKSKNK